MSIVTIGGFQYRVEPPPQTLSAEMLETYNQLYALVDLVEQSKKVWYSTSPKNKINHNLRKVSVNVLKVCHVIHMKGVLLPFEFTIEQLDRCFKPRKDPQYDFDWEDMRERARDLYMRISE